jgi:hypothetical protein
MVLSGIPFLLLWKGSFWHFLWVMEGALLLLVTRNMNLCLGLFAVNVAAGGCWMIWPQYGGFLAAAGLLAGTIYIKYSTKNNIYTVCLKNGRKKVCVKALYDTGNSLCLPRDGSAVFLVNYEAISSLIDWNTIKHPEILPYSSVGTEDGFMLAILLDEFVLLEKNIRIKHPYIGITRQPLSNDGSYQMILHRDIFK